MESATLPAQAAYLSPGSCLDCRLGIGEQPVCPRCGVPQCGPEADRLRALLGEAEVARVALRAVRAVPAAVVVPADAAWAGGSAAGAPQPWPAQPPTLPPLPPPRARHWPAFSTAAVLLGLGALCVLVAAAVFVSVSWSDLPLAAKAAILAGVTAGVGVLAATMLRRGLRGSAEALTVVTTVLVGMDALAAIASDLAGLGALSGRAAGWTVAALVVATGLGWAAAATRSLARRLAGVQLVAALGVVAMTFLVYGEAWAPGELVAYGLAAVLVAVASVAARSGLWTFAVAVCGYAALTVVAAFALSLGRVVEAGDLHALWVEGHAAGWVVGLILAGGAAAWPALPPRVRAGAAAVSVSAATLVVLRPLEGSSPNAVLGCLAAASAVLAVSSLLVAAPWRFGAAVAAVPPGIVAGGLMVPAVVSALARTVVPAAEPWSMAPTEVVDPSTHLSAPQAPWMVGLAAFAVLGAAFTLVWRRLPSAGPLALIATTASVLGVLGGDPLPLWAVVSTWAAAAAVIAGVGARTPRATMPPEVCWLLSAGTGLMAMAAALGSEPTTSVAAAVAAVALAAVAWAVRAREVAGVAVAAAALMAGLAVVAGLAWRGWTADAAAYGLVALSTAGLLGAQALGARRSLRLGLELGAAGLGAAAVAAAARFDLAWQLPVVLTLWAASLAAVSIRWADRRRLLIPAGVLFLVATWVRLAAEDVSLVEAYTLPAAIVLVAVGVARMRRVADASSLPALAPGLVLALVPSLVATAADPVSVRAVLLGAAALAVLLAGAWLRWVAPVLVGGAALAALAVVELAPYAAAVPRWVLLGAVGAGLLFLGVTWERRLRDVRAAVTAARSLR